MMYRALLVACFLAGCFSTPPFAGPVVCMSTDAVFHAATVADLNGATLIRAGRDHGEWKVMMFGTAAPFSPSCPTQELVLANQSAIADIVEVQPIPELAALAVLVVRSDTLLEVREIHMDTFVEDPQIVTSTLALAPVPGAGIPQHPAFVRYSRGKLWFGGGTTLALADFGIGGFGGMAIAPASFSQPELMDQPWYGAGPIDSQNSFVLVGALKTYWIDASGSMLSSVVDPLRLASDCDGTQPYTACATRIAHSINTGPARDLYHGIVFSMSTVSDEVELVNASAGFGPEETTGLVTPDVELIDASLDDLGGDPQKLDLVTLGDKSLAVRLDVLDNGPAPKPEAARADLASSATRVITGELEPDAGEQIWVLVDDPGVELEQCFRFAGGMLEPC